MPDLADLRFSDLLASISAKSPSPGGGAVACASGALAAALADMVVAYSLGKKSLAAHQGELEKASGALKTAQGILLRLGDEDALAFPLVNELMKLPESDPRRMREYLPAVQASIQVPMAAIAACDDLLRLCERLAPITNPHLHSDLAVAAVLFESAARASRWNVVVNAALLPDAGARERTIAEADKSISDAAKRRIAVEEACRH
jgi:formiminotetrahydrofolate cyclodeaminase